VVEGTGNEGIVGEQEGNLSSLTDSNPDRRRLIDEFYSHDGLMHFSDSEDKAEEKTEVENTKEETKVMTRSEYEKANIAPPPASKAPYPKGRRTCSLSPKLTSFKTTQTTSPPQTPKATIVPQAATQVVKPRQGPKVCMLVATDMLLDSTDPQHQPGSMTVHHLAPSPKQASTKTFASVASTPKTPTVTKPQQASPRVQTPTKPLQAKTDAKKTSPTKGEQQSKKGPNQPKGKVISKPKPVNMSQKIVNVNKQIVFKAKQADKTNSPNMKKPFDEVTKPSKTTERTVETPDGKGYQLLSEEEKKKADTAKKFEALGLLHFSDNEDDEFSLETITSDKSKGLNKSQGSQKLVTKPKPKQPTKPKQPITPKQPNNLMQRSGSKQVKENEMTSFHKDALSLAGGLTTPVVKGSSADSWTIQGSGKRQPNICQQFTPKALGNMLRIRNPTPPNSDSNSGSAGSNKRNRYAVLQENDEEEVSNTTTDVLPIGEIPESIQDGAVLIQPDSNEVPDNIQVEVAEPEDEGGATPQVEDPQPDGAVSSKDADFIKAESE